MRRSRWLTVLFAGLVGCSYARASKLGATSGRSDPARILLLATDDPGRPFTVVGVVSAQVDGEDPESLRAELVEAGAQLGADALVGTEIHWSDGAWSAGLRGSATAIKFR